MQFSKISSSWAAAIPSIGRSDFSFVRSFATRDIAGISSVCWRRDCLRVGLEISVEKKN
jgi:hypothetical protein